VFKNCCVQRARSHGIDAAPRRRHRDGALRPRGAARQPGDRAVRDHRDHRRRERAAAAARKRQAPGRLARGLHLRRGRSPHGGCRQGAARAGELHDVRPDLRVQREPQAPEQAARSPLDQQRRERAAPHCHELRLGLHLRRRPAAPAEPRRRPRAWLRPVREPDHAPERRDRVDPAIDVGRRRPARPGLRHGREPAQRVRRGGVARDSQRPGRRHRVREPVLRRRERQHRHQARVRLARCGSRASCAHSPAGPIRRYRPAWARPSTSTPITSARLAW